MIIEVRKRTDKKSSEKDIEAVSFRRLRKQRKEKEKENRQMKKSDWYDFLKKRINVINKSYRLEVNRVYRSMGSVLHKTLQKKLNSETKN